MNAKLKLDFEEHIVTIPGGMPTEFIIKPLDDSTKEIIRTLRSFGCEISFMPNLENPESIFVRYKREIPPQEAYGYYVVGVDMRLHLHLFGGCEGFDKRLERFATDVLRHQGHDLPQECNKLSIEYVSVINKYEY